MLALTANPDCEVSPVYPYIETDDECDDRKADMERRKQTLDPVAMEEKLRKAREAHFAKRGGVSG